ncbi:MAG: hypothetical protein K6A23_00285 [Butyrivibrio sp.]|nr:hypothetical protein [Butyrivibrio sp.]
MAEITLYVKMLGSFSITWNDKEIVLGRNKSAKFIKVLQIVWLAGEKGITKGQLVSRIYSDQEILTNLSNSINNLFYQMRKQMIKSGLPDYDYIVKKDSVFYIDDKTEIITDVWQFINAYSMAERADSEELKLKWYTRAFDIYVGELLPENAGELHVVTDSTLLKKRYKKVISWLGQYYKNQKRFADMYKIYERAALIYPDEDYQEGELEALIKRDMFKEAYELYDKTSRYYKEELGIEPSETMTAYYNSMSEHFNNGEKRIEDIKNEIVSLRPDKEGAYYCSYPGFVDCYHMMARTMERSGQSVYVMLCTLKDYMGNSFNNKDKLKIRSDELNEIIKGTLRYGDVYCRYSDSQYLILLSGSPGEGTEIVRERIRKKIIEKIGYKISVTFSAASIVENESYM